MRDSAALASFGILVAFYLSAAWDGKRLPKPLDAYPDQEGLGLVAKWHLAPKKDAAMLISWSWNGGPRNWSGIHVDAKGNAGSFREIYNHALQGGSITAVGRPKDPAVIEQFISKVGPSVKPPPIDDVLIVSFRTNSKWETRLFHRDHAPTPLVDLYRYLAKGNLGGPGTAPWIYRRKD
jgi:hypothetical protein